MNSGFVRFLYAPKTLREKWQWWQERVEDCLASCTSTTAHYGATGGGMSVGGGDAKDAKYAALADLVDRRDRTAKERDLAVDELELLLVRMTNADPRFGARDAKVLRLRYIFDYEMTEILQSFIDAGETPSLRTIYNWHSAATLRAEEMWLKTEKETTEHEKVYAHGKRAAD